MIKQFFAAMMLTAVMANSVFANNGGVNTERIIRQVKINTPVKKIFIYGNADVILTMDGSSEVSIEGKPVSVNDVKLVYQSDRLEIVAPEYNDNNKPVVRIPAQQLEVLEMHGDGKVHTESLLHSPKLNVLIDGTCEINIHSTGKVVVKATPDYRITYIKNEKRRIVSALN